MGLDVLYEDNHLLVVNKPAGLLTQPDHTGDPSLLDLGKAYLKEAYQKPGNVFLGLMHRLDRPASGVVVMARTSKAARRLTDQFRQRLPQKRYLAIVEGRCDGAGRYVDYLVKEDQQVHVVASSHPKAKRAELKWNAIAYHDGLSLLDVTLLTGRPHQVRVQCARRGFSLLGDFRYGATRPFDGRNLALHCYRLTVEHPTKREAMTWHAPLAEVWHTFFGEDLVLRQE